MQVKLAPLLLALILTGCVSPAAMKINEGKAAFERGDLVTAEALTRQGLAMQPQHADRAVALNNLGTFAERRGDRDAAVRAWTLAARMGDPTAQQNLLTFGEPIPTPDLLPQPAAASGSSDLDAALLLFLAGQQGGTCTHQKAGSYGVTKC